MAVKDTAPAACHREHQGHETDHQVERNSRLRIKADAVHQEGKSKLAAAETYETRQPADRHAPAERLAKERACERALHSFLPTLHGVIGAGDYAGTLEGSRSSASIAMVQATRLRRAT
jgi:hypothetical protein